MDQERHWMLTRRKLSDEKPLFTTPRIAVGSGGGSGLASYCESWEERAFAEDSAGHPGGCIWPPRSYSCSFCAREFRSAQALGGHMNVHRRDRARLKLSTATDDNACSGVPHQNYWIHPCPSQIGALQQAYTNPSPPNANPYPNSVCSVFAYPSRSLPHATAKKMKWSQHILSNPVASPSAGKGHGKKEVFLGAGQLTMDHPIPAARMCSNSDLRVGRGELTLSVLGCRTRRDFEDGDEGDEEENVSVGSQRRRINLAVSPVFMSSSTSKHYQQDDKDDDDDNYHHHAKVLKLCPGSTVEELDLELRLGDAQKLK